MNAATRGGLMTLDLVEAYGAAAERFAISVTSADLRAPVQGCPGWTAHDLVVHLGNVHAWGATIVETGEAAVEQNDEPRSAKGKVVSSWYAGKAEDLFQVLRQVPADRSCWNFVFGTGVAGFWRRRQLHETTIHQVDLDGSRDRVTELAPEVCVDGVDEALTAMLHRMHRRHPAALERPLALCATDTGDCWVVAPQGPPTRRAGVPIQPPSVQHRPAGGTSVPDRVEAPAAVLYRLLWHRLVDGADLRVGGDEDRVRAFLDSRLTP